MSERFFLCVSKLCVKDCVCQSCVCERVVCDKVVCDKAACERLCEFVTKLCVCVCERLCLTKLYVTEMGVREKLHVREMCVCVKDGV